jgi:hypothetical protein
MFALQFELVGGLAKVFLKWMSNFVVFVVAVVDSLIFILNSDPINLCRNLSNSVHRNVQSNLDVFHHNSGVKLFNIGIVEK